MRHIDEGGVRVTVYASTNGGLGLIGCLRQAAEDIFISRHVILRLFLRDFVAQFRQKIFGYFWALLGPLFGVFSFLFLFFIGVLRPGESEIPYTLYVLVGSTIWGCLPGAMGAVSGGLQAQADLIMRTQVPKIALALSALAGIAYSIIVSMATMAFVFLVIGVTPNIWFLAYPILILPMIVMGAALGLVLSVLGSIARDLTALMMQALSFVMFVTPVIYVPSTIQNPWVKALIAWNPITYLVDFPRTLICLGRFDGLLLYLLVMLGIILLSVVALRVFYLLEDLVAERL